ncbi:MAG: DUF2141 domain-containing protein [Polyangiales bacterium]
MDRAQTRILIQGVRNSDGQVACALFSSADGFPSEQDKAIHGKVLSAKAGTIEFEFEGVPHGQYAISVLHDENNNGRLDTNILGMPREGYGVSGNAFRRFGPPRYPEALIDLGPGAAVVIPMRYP